MKQTIVYEKEYQTIINKSYCPKGYHKKEPPLMSFTIEDNKTDNIRDYLSKFSMIIGTKEIEKMYSGSVFKEEEPNEFLWFKNSLFYIKLSEKNGEKEGNYKRIVEIQSMPPSEIPKTLEKLLIKKGFKKGEFKEKIPWWKQPEKK